MNKLLALSLASLPLFAAAESVQHEVTGSYTDYDAQGYSADAFSVGYTYYLNAMETAGAIKEELPFLRRASYIGGTFHDVDGSNFGQIDGRYFLDSDSFVGGGFSSDGDGDNAISIHGGRYFEGNGAYIVTLFHDFDSNDTGVDAGIRRVVNVGQGSGVAYGAGLGAYDFNDVGDSYFIRADATYYFSDFTGAGLALTYDGDESFMGYQFLFNHYFNERVGVVLSAGENYDGLENVTATVKGRF